jgi:hypothetical protein
VLAIVGLGVRVLDGGPATIGQINHGGAVGGGSNYEISNGFTFEGYMNPLGGVTVSIHNVDYSTWWQLFFAAANDEPMMSGVTYASCVRYPQMQDNTRNQMQLSSSNAPSCTNLSGSFTVKQLTWGPPFTVSSFHVTADQLCAGDAEPLHIELYFNMPLATSTTTTSWGKLKTMYR